MATVKGISRANQNEGYDFLLLAMAELWNIRGTVGNPYAKTKITGRYRGMGIAEDMVLNIIAQYPNGFRGDEPLFDDLLGIGHGGRTNTTRSSNTVYEDTGNIRQQSDMDGEDTLMIVGFVGGFIICKFVLHFGWILSVVFAFLLGGMFMYWGRKK